MVRLVCVVALLCTGCTHFDNPIVAASGPTLDPALLGEWSATSDHETLDLTIRRDGVAGVARLVQLKAGRPDESEEYTLITAHIGSEHFASLKSRLDPQGAWFFYRYEVVGGELLRINQDDGDFWKRSVANRMLSGTIEKSPQGIERARITASEQEMREFVQGYGSVIFRSEVAAEFRRRPD